MLKFCSKAVEQPGLKSGQSPGFYTTGVSFTMPGRVIGADLAQLTNNQPTDYGWFLPTPLTGWFRLFYTKTTGPMTTTKFINKGIVA